MPESRCKDEYGLDKPAPSYVKTVADFDHGEPGEHLEPWQELGRTVVTLPALLGGHLLDEMPGVDTCGRLKGPDGFGLADMGREKGYELAREEYERQHPAGAAPATPMSQPHYDDARGGYVDDTGAPVSYDPGPAPSYDADKGSYVDASGNPISYQPPGASPYEGQY